MRFAVVIIISVFPSLAFAAAYDIDTLCGAQPQDNRLKSLCTDPTLSSFRQLERSYWAALGASSTFEKYKVLENDLLVWRTAYEACGSGMSDQGRNACLTRAIAQFGDALDADFAEAMEDLVETDELLEAAQQSLSALDQEVSDNLTACRRNAAQQFNDGHKPANVIAAAIVQACRDPALDYVQLSLSEQDGTALSLLKGSTTAYKDIHKIADERYGVRVTVPFLLSQPVVQTRVP